MCLGIDFSGIILVEFAQLLETVGSAFHQIRGVFSHHIFQYSDTLSFSCPSGTLMIQM